MPTYQTDDKIIPEGVNYSTDFSIVVDPGDGDVQVQIEDSAGDWFTPDGEEYTLTLADVYVIDRRNRPSLKIVASGTAKFYTIGV
ncbi:hypothetical protein [Sulfitobacter sp. M22]|uniref:hypothetical protein n=1 Tax=Sulfitobacter sp. M22 TaxID=2675332 RepID=UPI001F28E1D9|nr:hypothetical protein [Sulfitobacter sp. M22]MCF7725788.1 hypothetical protein [Sulfitobacter sp. M22]